MFIGASLPQSTKLRGGRLPTLVWGTAVSTIVSGNPITFRKPLDKKRMTRLVMSGVRRHNVPSASSFRVIRRFLLSLKLSRRNESPSLTVDGKEYVRTLSVTFYLGLEDGERRKKGVPSRCLPRRKTDVRKIQPLRPFHYEALDHTDSGDTQTYQLCRPRRKRESKRTP